ncbi:HNH endonuclease [Anatilimnocola floriformis]|uniref:HNH endonuclease n=1 Tax=Anatilimnocola floriformis TaxID=2948575 RepID=UPI0020C5A483|nr:HNH endonuclease signature motif containing protein [Anatilimnocola floriformis]
MTELCLLNFGLTFYGDNIGMDDYHPELPSDPPKETKAKKLSQGPSARRKRKRERMMRQHPYCTYCGLKLNNENSTLDHIRPISRGGTNHDDNLVLSCRKCNAEKGDQLHHKWLRKKKNRMKRFAKGKDGI